MTYICDEFKGLTIVFSPRKYYKNQFDEINKTEGIRAKFFNGRYQTKDEKMIKLLDHWMEKHPGELRRIDEEKEKLVRERMEEAKKKALEEYEKITLDEVKKE